MASPPDIKTLVEWANTHLTVTKVTEKYLSNEFSDASLLAKILKVYYPSLVQLEYYTPRSTFSLRLVNWKLLNIKVLKKIDINLNDNDMVRLAKGKTGVIENVLNQLKVITSVIKVKSETSLNSEEFYFNIKRTTPAMSNLSYEVHRNPVTSSMISRNRLSMNVNNKKFLNMLPKDKDIKLIFKRKKEFDDSTTTLDSFGEEKENDRKRKKVENNNSIGPLTIISQPCSGRSEQSGNSQPGPF